MAGWSKANSGPSLSQREAILKEPYSTDWCVEVDLIRRQIGR
jgi:hypothetical protein